jgi:mono/diheme cytochrome c family protein
VRKAFILAWLALTVAAAGHASLQAVRFQSGERPSAGGAPAPATPVAVQSAAVQPADASPAAPARAVLNRYCVSCHNARLKTAGLLLDQLNVDEIPGHSEVWEKVARKLRTREMPPPGAPRPDDATYRTVVTALETALDAAAETTPHPGRVPVHRLNRTEYANAIRDLLGLEVDGRSLLPNDEPDPYGFDNVASVLTVSPALLESYMSAASKVSRLAVGDRAVNPVVDTFKIPTALVQDDRTGEQQPFGSRGGSSIRYQFPLDGDYTLKVILKRQLYLYIIGMGEPHQIDLRLDGTLVKRFTVGGEGKGLTAPESFAGNTQGDPKWEEYMHTADAGLEVRVPVKAGTREVSVSFVRKYWAPEGVLQPPQRGFARTTNELYYGDPAVESLMIGGPYQASGANDTPSRRKIFICRPASGVEDEGCARRILSTLARRAYRRPASDGEVQTLLDFYRAARRDGGDFDLGIERGLRRILSAPSFLFRVEHEPANLAAGAPYRLNQFDVASRLAFFLWSSVPDEALLEAATRGTLSDPAVLEREVRRMLRDPRSHALVDNFASQWLKLGKLTGVVPDVDEFPTFDENLREAMAQETRLFVASQRQEDRSVLDLLTANYTYVNERLARHYQIPNVYGSHFRRVVFDDGVRGGLLGQASILTVTSYPNRTSPVLRGRWLLETMLGAPPPAPPPDVPALKENGPGGERLPIRARLEAHRKNPSCAVCHVRMDPLGFSLENFDALGGWRTSADGSAIDAAAALPDGSRFEGIVGLRQLLLSHREDFVRTFTEKLMAYAVGRGLTGDDMPAVRKVAREAAPSDYRWSSIILGIVKSAPFGMSTSAQETPAGASARQ